MAILQAKVAVMSKNPLDALCPLHRFYADIKHLLRGCTTPVSQRKVALGKFRQGRPPDTPEKGIDPSSAEDEQQEALQTLVDLVHNADLGS